SGYLPSAIAVSDLNGDGSADVVTANSGADSESVLLSLSSLTVSISDASVPESDTGTTARAFTVTLSAPRSQAARVSFTTRDGRGAGGLSGQVGNGHLQPWPDDADPYHLGRGRSAGRTRRSVPG